MPLYQFGTEAVSFNFTQAGRQYLAEYEDNFSDLQPATSVLPGLSGAFDLYGSSSVAPTALGKIKQSIVLFSADRAGMDAIRDELKSIASWGKQMLTMRPTNYPTQKQRYCYARVSNIDIRKDESMNTDLIQRAQIEFEVSDPRWLVNLSTGMLWGGAWGGAWGDAQETLSASGLQTDISIDYNGNVPYELKIEVATGASQTCQYPTIQRVVTGEVIEQVRYMATLGNIQSLVIDPRRHRVQLDGGNVYNNGLFENITAAWMLLVPGTNTIRVQFANSGDAATVNFYYQEAYR